MDDKSTKEGFENNKFKKSLGLLTAIGATGGVLLGVEPDKVIAILGDTAQSQIAQAGFFFTLAAWIHAGRVKKEIANQTKPFLDAINNIGSGLRLEVKAHGDRIALVEDVILGLKTDFQSYLKGRDKNDDQSI